MFVSEMGAEPADQRAAAWPAVEMYTVPVLPLKLSMATVPS
jgi:hypothetical protein